MTKPALLIWQGRLAALVGDRLDDAYDIIRLWEHDDPDAALAARASDIVATFLAKERFDAAMFDRLPALRLIAVPGAGYEAIDIAAARARGIVVANAGDVHSGDVADHALALTLAALNHVPAMDAWVRDGRWLCEGQPPLRRSLSAHRFGILGLGNVGAAIARRLAAIGGEIAWWGPHDRPAPWPRRADPLDLARWCSVLIVAARGDRAGLVDRAIIDAVGPEGLIVNIARGQVIDEDALIAALKDGRLGQAALDVFIEEPSAAARWDGVPNIILSPHVGGSTEQALERLGAAAVRNLLSAVGLSDVVNDVTLSA